MAPRLPRQAITTVRLRARVQPKRVSLDPPPRGHDDRHGLPFKQFNFQLAHRQAQLTRANVAQVERQFDDAFKRGALAHFHARGLTPDVGAVKLDQAGVIAGGVHLGIPSQCFHQ